jgi:hypothetical protein
MTLRLGELKRGVRPLETNDPSPSLVDVRRLSHLSGFLGKARCDAATVDATYFQRNQPSPSILLLFEQKVRVFPTLQAALYAPGFVPMGQSQSHCFGTVLRDPIVVMLIHLGQGRSWPEKQTTTQGSFQIQIDRQARRVGISLQRERRTPHHNQSNVDRKRWVHLPQLLQINVHTRSVSEPRLPAQYGYATITSHQLFPNSSAANNKRPIALSSQNVFHHPIATIGAE